MSSKPNGLENILAPGEGNESPVNSLDPQYQSNGQGSPNKKRERIQSFEQHEEEEEDSEPHMNRGLSGLSATDFNGSSVGSIEHELKQHTMGYDAADFFQTRKEKFVWYLNIAIEGDLAGFQIAWLLMSVGFVIMKLFGITDVIETIDWWAIFVIPIINSLLTAWFDYIIRKFRSSRTIESLRKGRFIILWLIKVSMCLYVTTYWIWGPGSFMERYENDEDFQGTIYTIYNIYNI